MQKQIQNALKYSSTLFNPNKKKLVGFEVFTAVVMKSHIPEDDTLQEKTYTANEPHSTNP
jgi:hypothetical protein